MMAVCRFAHYLKVMVRDKIGSDFQSADELKNWLERWIVRNYVHADPRHASETGRASRPLAAAQVIVTEVEDNPGYYNAQFLLKPHYQLEGLTVSLRLVSKLNSAKSKT
jgi:type VI secretion system protein ImpC